jgi:hypothetical protein
VLLRHCHEKTLCPPYDERTHAGRQRWAANEDVQANEPPRWRIVPNESLAFPSPETKANVRVNVMKYYFRGVGTFLASAFVISGIFLVYDGMTHSTATNPFAIFAGSVLSATGSMLLWSLWERSKSSKGFRRHGKNLEV